MKERHARGRRGAIPANAAEELESLTDLAMGREALALAARVLESPRPGPREIGAALRAIGVHGDMKRWKRRVERMADRLPKRVRHAAREALLCYFACVGEHERAVGFIAAPRRFAPQTLYLATDSLIELRRFAEAKALVSGHLGSCWDTDDPFVSESAASVEAAEGMHLGALILRMNAPVESAIERDLLEGSVEGALALVIYLMGKRMELIRKARREAVFDPDQLAIPGNEDSLLAECEQRCERLRAKFTKLIPEARRFRYLLDPAPEPEDGGHDDPPPPERR